MAWVKLTHTGTPGSGVDGLGTHIRATLNGDAGFTTNWTVGAEKLFGATTTERSYFTLTHTNGLEVLIGVGNGNTIGISELAHSSWRNANIGVTLDHAFGVAINPVGGAGGFEDELNTAGTDPNADAGFWNAPEKSQMCAVYEWYEHASPTDLHFIYDDTNANMIIASISTLAARNETISWVAFGEDFIDGSSRPAADRLPRADGLLAVRSDDNAGGLECESYQLYTFPGGAAEFDLYSDTNSVDERYRLVDQGGPDEPDADGNYLSQSIVVQQNNIIRGIINFDMIRHLTDIDGDALNGKERKGGEFMGGPRNLVFRWTGAGNLTP